MKSIRSDLSVVTELLWNNVHVNAILMDANIMITIQLVQLLTLTMAVNFAFDCFRCCDF